MHGEVTFGLMGKHPGYGDFLRWGLSDPVVDGLTRWTDTVLPPLRDQTAEGWGAFWDNGQTLRFWVGRAVLGRTLAGVYQPSRDRVGRRFPLILLCEGVDIAAPFGEANQSVWEGIEAHMAQMSAGQGAKSLLEGLELDIETEDPHVAATGPTLWAHHPEGNLGALLRSATEVDATRAQLTRSYWWSAGSDGRSPVWLGCPGLPEAAGMGWLLAGVPAEDGA